jgi:hypothetical protein
VHDLVGARWIAAESPYSLALRTLPDDPADPVGTLATLAEPFTSFTYRRIAGEEWIYYCSLYGRQLVAYRVGDPSTTLLPWPVADLSCEPATLRYLPARNALLFTFQERGLHGVAEYRLP